MNAVITRLALQALLGRRRIWAQLALPVGFVGLAVLIRALTGDDSAFSLVPDLGYALVLPLVALLTTSAVLGPEIEDGSIVYLLAKPVSRHSVAVSKYVVAWVATLVGGALPLLVAGLVLDGGDPDRSVAIGVGAAAAGTAYCAIFLAMSAFTRHAVVAGLLFVLVWEGVLGSIFGGIARLSIAKWGQRVAAAIEPGVGAPSIGLAYALLALALVTVIGVWWTGDRLRSFTARSED